MTYFSIILLTNRIIFLNASPPITKSNIIILGDSHPQTAINPNYFFSAQNISQGAEPIVVSFWKLRYLVENVKFDTLIMGFSYQNISQFNDKGFFSGDISTDLFRRYYSIQRFKDIKQINLLPLKIYTVYFKNMCLFPSTKHFNFIGNFEGIESSFIDNKELRIRQQFYNSDNEVMGISNFSIAYMDSIINICKTKRKQLILVGTPIQKQYYDAIPNIYKENYSFLSEKYLSQNILFLDFNTFAIEEKFFYDSDHLNIKGAQQFSLFLRNLINTINE